MKYQPNFPDLDFLKSSIEQSQKTMEEFENLQQPLKYEDTFFKDLADDIKQSQEQINQKLDTMIAESSKSDRKSNRVAIITLVVGILTLIATVVGIVFCHSTDLQRKSSCDLIWFKTSSSCSADDFVLSGVNGSDNLLILHLLVGILLLYVG